MTKRRTIMFPNKIIDQIEIEVQKRLHEMNTLGEKMKGSAIRDIVCICVKKYLPTLQKLSRQEYEALLEQYGLKPIKRGRRKRPRANNETKK